MHVCLRVCLGICVYMHAQEVARHLDRRATERLLGLAQQDEADGIMNRDGNAQQFGLI